MKKIRTESSKMSEKSENSKEKVEGSVATEKAATDANKEEEKADLVSRKYKLFVVKKGMNKFVCEIFKTKCQSP